MEQRLQQKGPKHALLVEVAREESKFDLRKGLQLLRDAEVKKMVDESAKLESKIRLLRQEVLKIARKNFMLQAAIKFYMDQIGLAVRKKKSSIDKRMYIEDTMTMIEAGEKDLVLDHEEAFATVAHVLQNQPRYLSAFAQVLPVKATESFTQMVIFELFGDQHDPREERLLLEFFELMLEREIRDQKEKDVGINSLFRTATITTRLFDAYATRGRGLTVLRTILHDPLKKLIESKDNLELRPSEILREIDNLGEKALIYNRDAQKDVRVIEVQKRRVKELLRICTDIFKRIVQCVDDIPFGIRWICKRVGEIGKSIFPDLSAKNLDKLVGGFIYLRYLNPVIVNPSTIFPCGNLVKVRRRNLILVAKVLQNLSNGKAFGIKEKYMAICNDFLEQHRTGMTEFFKAVVAVGTLQRNLQDDELLSSNSIRPIRLTYEQIHLLHTHLKGNLDSIVPPEESDNFLRNTVEKLPNDLTVKYDRRSIILEIPISSISDLKKYGVTQQNLGSMRKGNFMEEEESLQKLCRSSRKEVADVKEGNILEYISGVKEELIGREVNPSDTSLTSSELVDKTMQWINLVVSTNSNGDEDDEDFRIIRNDHDDCKKSSSDSNSTSIIRGKKKIAIGYKHKKKEGRREGQEGRREGLEEEVTGPKVVVVDEQSEEQSNITNKAFWSMVQNYARRAQMKERLLERMEIVKNSRDTLVERTAELVTQRSFYKDYLVQVKTGSGGKTSGSNLSKSSIHGTSVSAIAAEEKKKKTFSLNVLKALGVIVQAEDDADENEFHFTCIATDSYVIKKYYTGSLGFFRSKILQSFRKKRFVASFSINDLMRIQEKG
mmetsp:Transcript_32532/g.52713  ORF Transcript_32532/g.52713 Transcript_32532/m.52713 type:complete len:832 (-) Transcript_32532:551-3046(-)